MASFGGVGGGGINNHHHHHAFQQEQGGGAAGGENQQQPPPFQPFNHHVLPPQAAAAAAAGAGGGGSSGTGAGTSESSQAGCSASEQHRAAGLQATGGGSPMFTTMRSLASRHYHHHHEMDGLAVFTWGRGEDGQLGAGDTSDQDEPTYVDALRGVGVQQIACGSGHTVVLTTEGEVLTWGRGDDGRLGHGDNGWKYIPRIIQSLVGHVIVQVTCGSYHTAAVDHSGSLFTWGGGMYGKLGHGNEVGHSTPKRVEALAGLPVSQIACGSRHTAIITSSGALYSWGDKENGVAGHGDIDGGHQYVPKLLEKLSGKRIVQLSACGFHTGCLTSDGELYVWGEGKFGRLGLNNERNAHSPRLVETLVGKKPRQVSCGGFHTAVVTEDGKCYTFGGGEHGQLGHNDRVNKLKPTLVQALEGVFVSQITCGWSHSVALTSSGRVFSFGNADHGKLGHGNSKKLSVPQMVEKLKDYRVVHVASYNEHTAALVEPFDYGLSGETSAIVTTAYTTQMRDMVNDEEFADVIFMVENQPVYAHRAILAQRSNHFAAMFRSGMRESVERTIPIMGISRPVFLMLLEFLYTDSVKIDVDKSIELYIAADIYRLERLRDMCCTVVRRNLTAENAGPLLQSADENHCQILRELCMSYIVKSFDIVSKTEGIKQVSHELLLEILAQR